MRNCENFCWRNWMEKYFTFQRDFKDGKEAFWGSSSEIFGDHRNFVVMDLIFVEKVKFMVDLCKIENFPQKLRIPQNWKFSEKSENFPQKLRFSPKNEPFFYPFHLHISLPSNPRQYIIAFNYSNLLSAKVSKLE